MEPPRNVDVDVVEVVVVVVVVQVWGNVLMVHVVTSRFQTWWWMNVEEEE